MGSPERESPVPEGTVPLSKRVRRATYWDQHAPGFEQASGLQAKSTGQSRLWLSLACAARADCPLFVTIQANSSSPERTARTARRCTLDRACPEADLVDREDREACSLGLASLPAAPALASACPEARRSEGPVCL